METLLLGNKGRIDFETPIPMTQDQQSEFVDLLKDMYDPVDVEYRDELRTARLGSREITARWTAKEYRVLLQFEDYSFVARKLGRTEMSIIMHGGAVIARLMLWCDEKNIPISQITLQHIETFLKEIEDRKIAKRQQKKLYNQVISKIDKMTNAKETPCVVGSTTDFGGECQNGFHRDCIICPRSLGFIKNNKDIELFNKIRNELEED